MNNTEKFDLWCIVELFGHTKIAGKCTEQNIAGTNMLRVDVPETKTAGEFTKFYGSAAIYAINPVSEEIARGMAEMIQIKPVQAYELPKLLAATEPEYSAPPLYPNDLDDEELPY